MRRCPPKAAKLPGLLVFQEAFGVNAHIRDVTERFARQGYVAIAPELFHRTAPGFDGSYTDFPSVMPHLQALTPDGLIADARAAFDWLQKNPRVLPEATACVGYCMGGRTSFLANSALPLKAAISYYGGGIAPGLLPRAEQQHGPMLFFWGVQDAHIPAEQVRAVTDAMKAAKKTLRERGILGRRPRILPRRDQRATGKRPRRCLGIWRCGFWRAISSDWRLVTADRVEHGCNTDEHGEDMVKTETRNEQVDKSE